VTEEVRIEEVLMAQDQDTLTDLDPVIPVLEAEVKEVDLIVRGQDAQLLSVIREVRKDQDPDVQILILVQEVQPDQDAQDVKLFC
jgi:hypothetical protein